MSTTRTRHPARRASSLAQKSKENRPAKKPATGNTKRAAPLTPPPESQHEDNKKDDDKPEERVRPAVASPEAVIAGGPMSGRMHTAAEFVAWMAPMGRVRCEKLFLNDPRFPRPIVGDDGGQRMWLTEDSKHATAIILREGWQRQRDRGSNERPAAAGQPSSKRRGRPPKPKPEANNKPA